MNDLIFDAEFEEQFAQRYLSGLRSVNITEEALLLEKLIFGLGLLEAHLIQLCVPYLEDNDSALLEYKTFFEAVEQSTAKLRFAMTRYVPQMIKDVWIKIDQHISELTAQTKPKNVLILAISVMVIRCALENLSRPPQLITLNRSRAHAAFRPKIDAICNTFVPPLLNATTDSDIIRNIQSAL